MENKNLNRLKVVLAEKKRTSKWPWLSDDESGQVCGAFGENRRLQSFPTCYKPDELPEESNLISKSLKQQKGTLVDMESNTMQFDYEFDVSGAVGIRSFTKFG